MVSDFVLGENAALGRLGGCVLGPAALMPHRRKLAVVVRAVAADVDATAVQGVVGDARLPGRSAVAAVTVAPSR